MADLYNGDDSSDSDAPEFMAMVSEPSIGIVRLGGGLGGELGGELGGGLGRGSVGKLGDLVDSTYSITLSINTSSKRAVETTNSNIGLASTNNSDKLKEISSKLPFMTTNPTLTYDQIPSVSKVPIKRKFYPPRRHLAPSNFETTSDWTKIEAVVSEFFETNGIRYYLPLSIAVFSVNGVPSDPNLEFDVHCCPTESSTFIIEFKRIRGDPFILAKLFFNLRRILGDESDNILIDQDIYHNSSSSFDENKSLSEEIFNPRGERMVYVSDHFNFDSLIK
jgi:hypothetical protein